MLFSHNTDLQTDNLLVHRQGQIYVSRDRLLMPLDINHPESLVARKGY
jgi:hypothetical protein